MIKNKEVEMKYNADNISPQRFKEFCISRKPHRELTVSGFDYFYSNSKDTESFFRYRETDMEAELTFKRKLHSNNVVRTEYNLPLCSGLNDKGEAFCNDMGYEYNTGVFKVAFIYQYDMHILCYYIVYNLELVELGRFIEIELKEHIDWESESSARRALDSIEKGCHSLGLTPLNRVSMSLFEMFRRKAI